MTIFNTLDPLGKFDGKVDEGFLVRYFNIDDDAAFEGKKPEFEGEKPESEVYISPSSSAQTKKHDDKTKREAKGKSPVELSTGYRNLSAEFEDFSDNSINEVNTAGSLIHAVGQILNNSTNTFSAADPFNNVVSPTHGKSSYMDPSQYPDDLNMPALEDITYSDNEEDFGAEADFTNLETNITVSPIPTTRVHKDHPMTQIIGDLSSATQRRSMKRVVKDQVDLPNEKRAIGTKWVFRNKKDERGIIVRNKARLVAQGHTQEEGIDYEEVFALVARIEAIRLFLAYASFMGVMVYQMDVKSAFLYGTIEEEVYVCQPPGFEDPNYPHKVYKVVKALYGLHQAPRAWYEILANYLLENDGKSASTPIDTEKPLHKDSDGEDVDVHSYRSMIGSLMYLTSSRPDIMFAVNDVIRLQAPVDRKKVIITEATIREALRLDDVDSIDCLPNKEIFTELSRMGLVRNVNSSTKFYMYLRFLQLMIRTQVDDLSSHTINYPSSALTQEVFTNIRRVGKGFSRVETPLFEGMILAQQADDVANESAAGVDVDVVPAAADEPYIPSPTPTTQPPPPSQELLSTSQQRVKKLERKNKLKVYGLRRLRKVKTAQRVESFADTIMDDQEDASKQGEIIANIDADDDVILKDVAAVEKDDEIEKNADVQGRQAESQAQIFKIDLEHADKVLSMQDDELEPAKLKEVVEVVTTAKLMTEVVTAASATITAASTLITAATLTAAPSAARRRKRIVIRDLEETATPSIIIHSEPKSKDKRKEIMDEVIEQVQRKEKEDNDVMSQAEKATKKQKLDKEVEELKKHIQIVPNDEDDVYNEVTPLARKVFFVDYEIYTKNNKPYYKIIKANGSHQLFLSFLSLLINFDREDLEVLWQLVKERFASSKPKNFSDDFLLTTLTYTFEKPNVQA
nr:putative ribonuclease H-like domain-containing protein [Tanacetum cinerariifolium]